MPPAFALSQDQTLRFISLETKAPSLTNKIPSLIPGIINASLRLNENFTSVSVTHQKNTRQTRPLVFIPDDRTKSNPVHHPAENPILPHTRVQNSKDAANVSLPSLFDFQRAPGKLPGPSVPSEPGGPCREAPSRPPSHGCQREFCRTPIFSENSLTY